MIMAQIASAAVAGTPALSNRSGFPAPLTPQRLAHGTGPVEAIRVFPSPAAVVEADRIHAILQGRNYNQREIMVYAATLLNLSEGRGTILEQNPIELSAKKYWDLHHEAKGSEYIAGLATYLRDDAEQQIEQEERAQAIYSALVEGQKYTGRQVLTFVMNLIANVIDNKAIPQDPTAALSQRIFQPLMAAGGERQVLGIAHFLIGFSSRAVARELSKK
jgi:hypothetical protein